ncbi:MAG TPA: MOSC N-terminal beta barrel domain-containing protein [Anaerolineales bacterium]|jgi:hypothetical protein
MIQLSSLTYFPIKSCRGFDVQSALAARAGLAHDRQMMVVTPEGAHLTQREHHRLALVVPALADGCVQLSAPDFDSIQIPISTSGATVPVNIRDSKGVQAVDQGDEAAAWFSAWLNADVRLVHIADGYQRLVDPQYAVRADDHTGFTDGFPILIASEESLADLNARLETPIPMNRFRPNLVIRGCEPFAEDTWKRIRIVDLEMAVVKACARCVVTTIDKETLETSREPLKTLATYRKQKRGVMFGQNVIPLGDGSLEVGMPVEILA